MRIFSASLALCSRSSFFIFFKCFLTLRAKDESSEDELDDEGDSDGEGDPFLFFFLFFLRGDLPRFSSLSSFFFFFLSFLLFFLSSDEDELDELG